MASKSRRSIILIAAVAVTVLAVACSRARSGDNETGDGIPAVPANATSPTR